MAWRAAETGVADTASATPITIPDWPLPKRVRPWIKVFTSGDKVELVSIRVRGQPGAAVAFAQAVKRLSQRHEGDIPMEISERIWRLALLG